MSNVFNYSNLANAGKLLINIFSWFCFASVMILTLSFCSKVISAFFNIIASPFKSFYKKAVKYKKKYNDNKRLEESEPEPELVLVGKTTVFDKKAEPLTKSRTTIFKHNAQSSFDNAVSTDTYKTIKIIENLKNLRGKVKSEAKSNIINKDIERLEADLKGDKTFINKLLKSNKKFKHLYGVNIENEGSVAVIEHVIITNNVIYAINTSSSQYIPTETLYQSQRALSLALGSSISDFTIKPCFVATSDNINGEYTIGSFISEIEANEDLDIKAIRISNLLSEFNVPLISNYFDKYDLKPTDF